MARNWDGCLQVTACTGFLNICLVGSLDGFHEVREAGSGGVCMCRHSGYIVSPVTYKSNTHPPFDIRFFILRTVPDIPAPDQRRLHARLFWRALGQSGTLVPIRYIEGGMVCLPCNRKEHLMHTISTSALPSTQLSHAPASVACRHLEAELAARGLGLAFTWEWVGRSRHGLLLIQEQGRTVAAFGFTRNSFAWDDTPGAADVSLRTQTGSPKHVAVLAALDSLSQADKVAGEPA